CGICPTSHAIAYTRAVESAMKLRPPKIVRYLRTMEMELERLSSHMLWTGYMAHEIGYEALFMFFWRERENILDVLEKVTGGRIHHNYHTIGSVRFGLQPGDDRFILDRLASVEKKMARYLKTYRSDPIIKARLKEVGVLTKGDAKRLCLVGPTARGSGITNDVRKLDPHLAYPEVDFEVPLEDRGDAWSRTLVRVREILESIKIIRQLVKGMPKGKIPAPVSFGNRSSETTGRSEAPRGEDYHFLKIKEGVIERAKIRTPTFANIISLEYMLKGREIGDTPVILASLDPCFACMERVLIAKGSKIQTVTEEQFRNRYTKTLTEKEFRRKARSLALPHAAKSGRAETACKGDDNA
ncbi:MAG: nickel-dependent hydrogenase large subunit, partial [Candidatus Aenigmatarchaeota archaeon]